MATRTRNVKKVPRHRKGELAKSHRRRNPQDTTLRNARAATKAIAALTVRVRHLEEWNRLFRRRLQDKKR